MRKKITGRFWRTGYLSPEKLNPSEINNLLFHPKRKQFP
jgi:hypothetical protein